MASRKVSRQFFILARAHVARPDNFRGIDIGCVEHHILVKVVAWIVSHDHEVVSRALLQLRLNARAIGVR